MATGLNLNLEEQALLAGKQCMETLVTWIRCKLATKPSIPSFDKLCTKTEEIFGKNPFQKKCRLGTAQLEGHNFVPQNIPIVFSIINNV